MAFVFDQLLPPWLVTTATLPQKIGGNLYPYSLQTASEAENCRMQKCYNLMPKILVLYSFFKLVVKFQIF